ncbi:hypothetical protein ACWDX6_20560 [Streptomyces sp. NPDC003027]
MARTGREECQVTAASYGLTSAETYKRLKEQQDGVTDVQIVEVRPGE